MAKRKTRKSPYIPPQSEVVNRKQRVPTAKGAGRASTRGTSTARGGKVPQPPSWFRVLKQVPIYYVLIVGVNYLLTPGKDSHHHALKGMDRLQLAASSSLLVVLAFVPLMYYLDRSRWKRYNDGVEGGGKRGQGIVAR